MYYRVKWRHWDILIMASFYSNYQDSYLFKSLNASDVKMTVDLVWIKTAIEGFWSLWSNHVVMKMTLADISVNKDFPSPKVTSVDFDW